MLSESSTTRTRTGRSAGAALNPAPWASRADRGSEVSARPLPPCPSKCGAARRSAEWYVAPRPRRTTWALIAPAEAKLEPTAAPVDGAPAPAPGGGRLGSAEGKRREAAARIRALTSDLLEQARRYYHEDAPQISDAEYD